jgi:hypothetical protein
MIRLIKPGKKKNFNTVYMKINAYYELVLNLLWNK